MSTADRFWSNVDRSGPNACWLWTGALNGSGYGRLSVGGRQGSVARAHRFAYELLIGPIPDDLDLDHLCRVRHCVNPSHLEPVTRRVNTLRSPIAITAVRARQTHCRQGHEFTPENTYTPPSRPNSRYCRECKRQRDRGCNRHFADVERHMSNKHPGYADEATDAD